MMRDVISRQLVVFISFLLISGCVSQRDMMLEQGYPVSYADGFDDGCHSGKQAEGSLFDEFKKDVSRFETDVRYQQGWSDGYRQCESEEEALQRKIRMNIERQRLIEEKKRRNWSEERYLEREVLEGIDTSGLENLKGS